MPPAVGGQQRDALGRVDHRAAADAEHHVAAGLPVALVAGLDLVVLGVRRDVGPHLRGQPGLAQLGQQLGRPAGLDEPGVGDDERTARAEPQPPRAPPRAASRRPKTISGAWNFDSRMAVSVARRRRRAASAVGRVQHHRVTGPPCLIDEDHAALLHHIVAPVPHGTTSAAVADRVAVGRATCATRLRAGRLARPMWMGPSRSASRRPAAAPVLGDHLRGDGHRGLLRGAGAQVQPDRARTSGRARPR